MHIRSTGSNTSSSSAVASSDVNTTSPTAVVADATTVAVGLPSVAPQPAAKTSSPDDMEVDDATQASIALQARFCKYNEFSHLPERKSNSILIPIIVENVQTFGLVHTGATFSIISPSFFRSLESKVPFTSHVGGTIQLGHSDSTKPRIGLTILNIFYNRSTIKFKFEIFDFFSDVDNVPILLGLDILPKLNIGITGLVSSWFEYTGPALPAPIDPDDINPNDSPYGTDLSTSESHNETCLIHKT
ncbi:MAG: hypothetical protein EXX96DRAFT_267920 [Benjaminiella poitrasii]|nr:MAG: hypothetical protein EXX96DRAFT_267920 [Benjaminiella poitrasii]